MSNKATVVQNIAYHAKKSLQPVLHLVSICDQQGLTTQ